MPYLYMKTLKNGDMVVPVEAEESLYIERLGKKEAIDFAKWAADWFDHIVVHGNCDTGWYQIWCWNLTPSERQGEEIREWGVCDYCWHYENGHEACHQCHGKNAAGFQPLGDK